jgi:predicted nucleotidyltransferase
LASRLKNKRMLKKIVSTLSTIKDVKAIILHGSFAREDYGPKSDIDLLLITNRKGAVEDIENAIVSLDVGRSIQPIVRTEKEIAETASGLLQNLFLEGKILFLREPIDIHVAALLSLKPFVIYTFDLAHLDQKTKARFNRAFYPRARDNYEYPGLLSTLQGEKLASGCITVPFSEKKAVERLFRSFKVKPNAVRIWK